MNLYDEEINAFIACLEQKGWASLDIGFEEKLYVNSRNVESIFVKPVMAKTYDWKKSETQAQEFWNKQDITKLKKE